MSSKFAIRNQKASFVGFLFSLASLLSLTASASPFYDYKVIAQAGGLTPTSVDGREFLTLKGGPSINDAGKVVFVATFRGGEGVYVSDTIGGQSSKISTVDAAFAGEFQGARINRAGQVVVQRRTPPPIITSARRYSLVPTGTSDASPPSPRYTYDTIAEGSSLRRTVVHPITVPITISLPFPHTIYVTISSYTTSERLHSFDDVLPNLAINDHGDVAYAAHLGNNYYVNDTVAGGNSRKFNEHPGPLLGIDDRGRVFARDGTQAGSSFALFHQECALPMYVTGQHYRYLDAKPALSANGKLVIFVGDRGGGMGIFASRQFLVSDLCSPWMVDRIFGENTVIEGPHEDLGKDGLDPIYFQAFESSSAVGLVHFEQGAANDSFTITFIATPNQASSSQGFSAAKGVWTARVEIAKDLSLRVAEVLPVMQVGDSLNGQLVTDFTLLDATARASASDLDHRVTFVAKTGISDLLVTATHIDDILTLRRLKESGLELGPHPEQADVDDLLILKADPKALRDQPKLGLGLVADGVTPMLIKYRPPQAPAEPATYDVSLRIESGGHLKSGELQEHVWVLNSSGDGYKFQKGVKLTISPTDPIGYAYLEGLRSEDIEFDEYRNELDAVVLITPLTASGDRFVRLVRFKIRKPPVVLVHGYHADKGTWSQSYRNMFLPIAPEDFIKPIDYGVISYGVDGVEADPKDFPNTKWTLEQLAPELERSLADEIEKSDSTLRREWAFTRYDAVGHSQGGVLLRMLCTEKGLFSKLHFRSANNFYRGRFRRVITIGSPHNGSILMHWALNLLARKYEPPGGFEGDDILSLSSQIWEKAKFMNLFQWKFDPFMPGPTGQISLINSPPARIDPAAKFHLIGTTIAGGEPSGHKGCPKLHLAGLLCGTLNSHPELLDELHLLPFRLRWPEALHSADFVIPLGSDGIVDLNSQFANNNFNKRTYLNSEDIGHGISHSADDNRLPGIGSIVSIFGVKPLESQTQDPVVAAKVVELLSGSTDSFGPFFLPDPQVDKLMEIQKRFMDSFFQDKYIRLIGSPKPVTSPSPSLSSGGDQTQFQYQVDVPVSEPPAFPIGWSAKVFGTNGISTDGVAIHTLANDGTRVIVTVSNGIVGDVVLFASYQSSNDHYVSFAPAVVYSFPAASGLSRITLVPATASLAAGDQYQPELWGTFPNGTRRLLFTSNSGEPAYSLVNSNGVLTLSNNLLRAAFPGHETVRADYLGLTARAELTVRPTPQMFPTNSPPIGVDDSTIVAAGTPGILNVLANDSAPDGILDPSTVTLTREPTNGVALVNPITGTITYTPNPGSTNADSFRYTVQDDLGAVSPEATVTVQVLLPSRPPSVTAPPYRIVPISSGATDHRYPRINNVGGYVYQQQSGLGWQVSGTPKPSVSETVMTSPEGIYTDATFPALADDGMFTCSRGYRSRGDMVYDIIRYPTVEMRRTNAQPTFVFQVNDARQSSGRGTLITAREQASFSANGLAILSHERWSITLAGTEVFSYLSRSGSGIISGGDSWSGNFPDINADGHFVYSDGNRLLLDFQVITNEVAAASIGDAPKDSPDIVYSSNVSVNGPLNSTRFGQLLDHNGAPITGTWVDINRSGVLIFDKLVGDHFQVFKAYPIEPRIVSIPGTNGIVGLRYRYDSDNRAEAYGDLEENDPRSITPLRWEKLEGPSNLSIDPQTGEVKWVPAASGRFTVVLRAYFYDYEIESEVEHVQSFVVDIQGATIDLVDAVDFRIADSVDLSREVGDYFQGGVSRFGAVSDGASRLVLRAELPGVETNEFGGLLYSIIGSPKDGLLRAVAGTEWEPEVGATVASSGGTNRAVGLYQAPVDLDDSLATVVLKSGTNIIASREIRLRPPSVVLVHDQWSGPDSWGPVLSALLDAGHDLHLFDYQLTSGGGFATNFARLFETVNKAVGRSRSAGYAASGVDIIGHGTGGLLARLHIQKHSFQADNYGLGDVRKLITVGTPHGGSELAGILTSLQATNSAAFEAVRSIVLATSESWGMNPPVDIAGGSLFDASPASPTIRNLEPISVSAHAIATTVMNPSPGDPISLLHLLLGRLNFEFDENASDGLASVRSALGGLRTEATTIILSNPPGSGIVHSLQLADPVVASEIVRLMAEPIVGSLRFSSIPSGESSFPNLTPSTNAVPTVGSWVALRGLTNGQVVLAGSSNLLTAVSTDGRVLSNVQFISPAAAIVESAPPFQFGLAVPNSASGSWRVSVIARDTEGQIAFASATLIISNSASLQSLEVEPPLVELSTFAPVPLRVWGTFSDGVRRDMTSRSSGTRYVSSDRFQVFVSTNGVLSLRPAAAYTPIVVGITNGAVGTTVAVTVRQFELPPEAVIRSVGQSGPAPLYYQFDGALSQGAAAVFWDFGNGQTSQNILPAKQRYVVPGEHRVVLRVRNSAGRFAQDIFPVVLGADLILDGTPDREVLTLEEEAVYNHVTVTSNALLSTLVGLRCGELLSSSTISIDRGELIADSVRLSSNGVLTVRRGIKLSLDVTNDLEIAEGGRIDLNGKGYEPGITAGGQPRPNDSKGIGGSHGGIGGGDTSGAYDDFADPHDSGAGAGFSTPLSASGGGLARIKARRLLVNGAILADGESGPGWFNGGLAGGAGGGLRIDVGKLSGTGMIRAAGGRGGHFGDGSGFGAWGGAGGGGRIAIYYSELDGFDTSHISAPGGGGINGSLPGGPGTIYLKKDRDEHGELTVDNLGNATERWSTQITNASVVTLRDLSLRGASSVAFKSGLAVLNDLHFEGLGNSLMTESFVSRGSTSLKAGSEGEIYGPAIFSSLILTNGGQLTLQGESRVGSLELTSVSLVNNADLHVGRARLGASGVLTVRRGIKLSLDVTNDLEIAEGGRIDLNGKGYEPGITAGGQRRPNDSRGIGGSHGGVGGEDSSGGYDDFADPHDFGAGAGFATPLSASGGGLAQIKAAHIRVNGAILADGESGPGWFNGGLGGAAGGGVRIEVGELSGTGVIRAAGGRGGFFGDSRGFQTWGEGGGGGRIAIYYSELDGFDTSHLSASGGKGVNGSTPGGPGTIYLKRETDLYGDLIINDEGLRTESLSTVLSSNGVLRLKSLTISSNAHVSVPTLVRVALGNPTEFEGLIRDNHLRIGGLIVSNTWVYGDMIDMEIAGGESGVGPKKALPAIVTAYCRPNRTYLLLASTNFIDWVAVATNSPAGSRFDYIDARVDFFGHRYFRAVMEDQLYERLDLLLHREGSQPRPSRATLTVGGAQAGHTLVIQSSPDLRVWTPLETNTITTTTDWPFLDIIPIDRLQRFYRVIDGSK